MIKKCFFIAIIALIFLSCQKRNSNTLTKIDEIEFSYLNSRRIPFSEVKINISGRKDKDSAIVFIQSRPSSYDPTWNYSKIEKFMTVDLKTFEKLVDKVSSLDKINIKKAYADGKDGSIWQIQCGSKGINKSYRFWSPNYNTKERGLTAFK